MLAPWLLKTRLSRAVQDKSIQTNDEFDQRFAIDTGTRTRLSLSFLELSFVRVATICMASSRPCNFRIRLPRAPLAIEGASVELESAKSGVG